VKLQGKKAARWGQYDLSPLQCNREKIETFSLKQALKTERFKNVKSHLIKAKMNGNDEPQSLPLGWVRLALAGRFHC
jgi:hypothetical protein